MEKCEDIRHTIGMKEVYAQRKETVERLFGTAKENHGFRYTQMIGKARMEMKVGLTFAYMNLKKLAKMIARKGKRGAKKCLLLIKYTLFEPKTRKTLLECWPKAFCLQSEGSKLLCFLLSLFYSLSPSRKRKNFYGKILYP